MHWRLAHIEQGLQAIGLRGNRWRGAVLSRMGFGAGQRDGHDLVASRTGGKGFGGVGKNNGAGGAGASLEDGPLPAGGRVDQADGVAQAVGDGQRLAVR